VCRLRARTVRILTPGPARAGRQVRQLGGHNPCSSVAASDGRAASVLPWRRLPRRTPRRGSPCARAGRARQSRLTGLCVGWCIPRGIEDGASGVRVAEPEQPTGGDREGARAAARNRLEAPSRSCSTRGCQPSAATAWRSNRTRRAVARLPQRLGTRQEGFGSSQAAPTAARAASRLSGAQSFTAAPPDGHQGYRPRSARTKALGHEPRRKRPPSRSRGGGKPDSRRSIGPRRGGPLSPGAVDVRPLHANSRTRRARSRQRGQARVWGTVQARPSTTGAPPTAGFLYTMADAAFALASNSHGALAGRTVAHMEYLSRCRAGEVLTRRRTEVHLGRRIAVCIASRSVVTTVCWPCSPERCTAAPTKNRPSCRPPPAADSPAPRSRSVTPRTHAAAHGRPRGMASVADQRTRGEAVGTAPAAPSGSSPSLPLSHGWSSTSNRSVPPSRSKPSP